MEQIELSGIGKIKVRRGMNIKFMSIRMSPGRGVWVNVPYGVSGRQVLDFLEGNREWIVRTQAGMKAYEKDTGAQVTIGSDIATKMHTLHIVATNGDKPEFTQDNRELTLALPFDLPYERVALFIDKVLTTIYAHESQMILPDKVRAFALRFGFSYGRLSFRNNVSNWGSCSGKDDISLNIKLMKLPDELIDYVILHELCHTLEKNHSDRFWKLMSSVCPDYKTLNATLRQYHTRM